MLRALSACTIIALWCSLAPAPARAQAEGECATGFCGTPRDVGGTQCVDGVCNCVAGECAGGSILINNTDMGETYSTSDDFDNDGLEDDFDNCPWVANTDQADSDGDGIGDACDNCPGAANADLADLDGDGIGDACDPDQDGDGVANGEDNCPDVPNPSQKDGDGNGMGTACDALEPGAAESDEDGDGIPDAVDNAPGTYNPDQSDINGNGVGDVVDPDADGDGVPNALDNAPYAPNPDQIDADHDGLGDVADPTFCYVYDPVAKCLDPMSTFEVGGLAARAGEKASRGAVRELQTGEEIGLHLFANRLNAPMRYTWALAERPEGSDATVRNAWGVTVYSGGNFEYHYHKNAFPTFTPDEPGTYRIKVVGELVFGDDVYAGGPTRSEHILTVTVTGESTASGCSVAGGAAGAPAGLLVLLALALRRRRR